MDKFDPYSAQLKLNRYSYYQNFQLNEPVHWGLSWRPGLAGCWYVFGYRDVFGALKDARLRREEPQTGNNRDSATDNTFVSSEASFYPDKNWAVFRDAPAHPRLRSLLQHAFSRLNLIQVEPDIENLAKDLLALWPETRRINFMLKFAELFPLAVMAHLFGFEKDEAELFTGQAFLFLSPTLARRRNPFDHHLNLQRSRDLLTRLFRLLIERRKNKPAFDLVSYMLAARFHSGGFSEEELLSNCYFLLITGYDTTVNLIGNGLLVFLNNPEQLKMVQANLALLTPAIEEILRFESPLQMVDRWVGEDLEIGGKKLHQGDRVYLVLGAAHRDSSHYSQPEHFDITRKIDRHLAFGAGPHACLGATLARFQARVALANILPRLTPAHPQSFVADWRADPHFRALNRLDLIFSKETSNVGP